MHSRNQPRTIQVNSSVLYHHQPLIIRKIIVCQECCNILLTFHTVQVQIIDLDLNSIDTNITGYEFRTLTSAIHLPIYLNYPNPIVHFRQQVKAHTISSCFRLFDDNFRQTNPTYCYKCQE